MKIRNEFTCPLELIFDFLKGKWKPIIIWRLRLGKTQLTSLNNDITGINQKMLIQHLKELMESGIVDKITYDGYPLKVEYFLTDFGLKILEGLRIFQNLGLDYIESHDEFTLSPNCYREPLSQNKDAVSK